MKRARPQVLGDPFSLNALKERGWTPALVTRFLGAPDRFAPNPKYKSAPKMQLYFKHRVLATEADPFFQVALRKLEPRRQNARRAVETKRTRTLDHAQRVKVSVPSWPLEELAIRAAAHYNARKQERGRDDSPDYGEPAWFPPWSQSSPFRDRVCVNYLRHELSSYEETLRDSFGRVGKDDARRIVFQRVMDAISTAYPTLVNECRRQYSERFTTTARGAPMIPPDHATMWHLLPEYANLRPTAVYFGADRELNLAYWVAFAAHAGQYRRPTDARRPFIVHPLGVLDTITAWHSGAAVSPRLARATLLHDAVEDSCPEVFEVTLDMIRTQFGQDDSRLVSFVTHLPLEEKLAGLERAHELLAQRRVARSLVVEATLLKVADRYANLGDYPPRELYPKYLHDAERIMRFSKNPQLAGPEPAYAALQTGQAQLEDSVHALRSARGWSHSDDEVKRG